MSSRIKSGCSSSAFCTASNPSDGLADDLKFRSRLQHGTHVVPDRLVIINYKTADCGAWIGHVLVSPEAYAERSRIEYAGVEQWRNAPRCAKACC
jgi:hypothetical protein